MTSFQDKTCIGIQNKKKLVVWNEVMRWRRKKKNIIKKMIVTRGHILGYFYPPALLAMFSVFSNFYGWRSESSNLRIKPCPTHAENWRRDVFDLNLENLWLGFYFRFPRATILLEENCCFLMARGLELWQVIQVSLKQRFYNCWESFFSNKPCRNWRFWSSLHKNSGPHFQVVFLYLYQML